MSSSTPIKSYDLCISCGEIPKEKRIIDASSDGTQQQKDLHVLLLKYAQINVFSGTICRNCHIRLLNIDKKCTAFSNNCQKNYLHVTRMNLSPSVTQVSTHIHTPLKSVKKLICASTPSRTSKLTKQKVVVSQEIVQSEKDILAEKFNVDSIDVSVLESENSSTHLQQHLNENDVPVHIVDTEELSFTEQSDFITHNISDTVLNQQFVQPTVVIQESVVSESQLNSLSSQLYDQQELQVNYTHSLLEENAQLLAASADQFEQIDLNQNQFSMQEETDELQQSFSSSNLSSINNEDTSDNLLSIPNTPKKIDDHNYGKTNESKVSNSIKNMRDMVSSPSVDHTYVGSYKAPIKYNESLKTLEESVKFINEENHISADERCSLLKMIASKSESNVEDICEMIMNIPSLRNGLIKKFKCEINTSATLLTARTSFHISQLNNKSDNELDSFNWYTILDEFMDKMPILLQFILSAIAIDYDYSIYSKSEQFVPRLCMIYGIIMQTRFRELSMIQRLVSLLLNDSLCARKVFDRLNVVGVSLSYDATLKMLDFKETESQIKHMGSQQTKRNIFKRSQSFSKVRKVGENYDKVSHVKVRKFKSGKNVQKIF